ncbi:hypothetical protein J1D01_12460 [Seonamhaeicola sp. NFXS20]|uniref:hypothetical protein n=1 Tax=Seonamhaeicola sp. NFXS20 TaxID=2816959 RepID=UPI003B8B1ED6
MKNKSTIKNYSISLIFLISFFSFTAFAQESEIYELKSESNSSTSNKTSSKEFSVTKSSKSLGDSREEFTNLSKKLHATVYLKNKKVKRKYGNESPIKLTFEDMNSFKELTNNNSNYNKVKLITILINNEADLNNLDLSKGKKMFPRLKYIYLKCLFNGNTKQIEMLVKKPDNNVRVFYTFEKAS